MEKDYIIEVKKIDKQFHKRKNLDSVSLGIERGTIHGLVGENGAGKSTLIKIIAGIYQADAGEVYMNGRLCGFASPIEARRAGISVIHQEIKLAEPLSVTENMFLGNLLYKNGLVDWKAMKKQALEILDELGMDMDVDAPVETLSVAKKQIVEIVHAINFQSKVLIMDEPSAILTDRELEVMFRIIKKLRAQGITIIYISHRLDEIFDLCDNVTVLRDGQHIGTFPIGELDRTRLIKMMVGREMDKEYPKEKGKIGEPVLEVRGLNCGILKDISFSVRSGEVFGISGLVGAGRTELARAILGIDKKTSGEIFLQGKKVNYKSFSDAISDGLGLIPEDRKLQGLVQMMPIHENITLANLRKITKYGLLDIKAENEKSKNFVKKLHIACASIDEQVSRLSGGNQQKVVIAKWLFRESGILFLDEPTRGVDIGAKVEIYKLINEMIQDGKTVILISSEMPELLGMCDRIMVMHEGRIKGEFTSEEATQEKIMALCT